MISTNQYHVYDQKMEESLFKNLKPEDLEGMLPSDKAAFIDRMKEVAKDKEPKKSQQRDDLGRYSNDEPTQDLFTQ